MRILLLLFTTLFATALACPFAELPSRGGPRVRRAPRLTKRRTESILDNCTLSEPQECGSDYDNAYRRSDGNCNNVEYDELGGSDTALARWLPAEYEAGSYADPQATQSDGSARPNPRVITQRLFRNFRRSNHHNHSVLVMQWGQFIAHDLVYTTGFEDEFDVEIDCCENVETGCTAIPIAEDDEFYSTVNRTCMNFIRSAEVQDDCDFTRQELYNWNTAYVDASTVYGSHERETIMLREDNGTGRYLRGQTYAECDEQTYKPLLPAADDQRKCASDPEKYPCFLAGDTRSSATPGLAAMHTVWMREHNRLVDGLAAVQPDWDDETLFQEARKILIAEVQHITYKEYLPRILGDTINDYDLTLLNGTDRYTGYTAGDPSISDIFAVAGFRYGHSQIHRTVQRGWNRDLRLKDAFNNMETIYKFSANRTLSRIYGVDPILLGTVSTRVWRVDRSFASDVMDHLDANGRDFGDDLLALDIQRSRDHGLPGYNKWRAFCGLETFANFTAMREHLYFQPMANAFSRIFVTPDDLDVWLGAVYEEHVSDGEVGPLTTCIVGKQFEALRRSDRYWYETDNPNDKVRFTDDQLVELRKVTIAKVMCNNADGITKLRRDVWRHQWRDQDPAENPWVMCSDMDDIDFSKWATT